MSRLIAPSHPHHLFPQNKSIDFTGPLLVFGMDDQNQRRKPHAVMFPAPGLGHLIPLVQFSKHLAVYHDFSITFITINWHASSQLFAYTKNLIASSDLDIRFIELPEVDFEVDKDMKMETLLSKLMEKCKGLVEDVLGTLQDSSSPVCAFVTDVFCTTMLNVAANLRIPAYIFFPSSAFVLAVMLYLPKLASEIHVSFKDANFAVNVPGLPPIPARDLPTPIQDRNDDAFYWFVHHCSRLREARGILINTFHDLEFESVKALVDGEVLSRDEMPAIYTVGPLISEKVGAEDKTGCLKWLDGQPAFSVLFVSFGSGGALSAVQIEELALGLEASHQRFLWVVRHPHPASTPSSFFKLEDSDISQFLPEGFEGRTKDRGLVVSSWAPQIPILSHPSTAGFISHCGWNSTLESISFGVPIIAWPLLAEQRLNRLFLVNEIKIAIEAKQGEDGIVRKEEVERVARELMEGEEGIKVRMRAQELQENAKRASAEGGSSCRSFGTVAAVWKNMPSDSTKITAQRQERANGQRKAQ